MSPCRSREGDDPDRRGPPVGGRGEGAPIWAERGKWAGGREEFGPREKKKEREREVGWAGRAENKGRKKKRLCIFETKSNNSIQTQIQRIQI